IHFPDPVVAGIWRLVEGVKQGRTLALGQRPNGGCLFRVELGRNWHWQHQAGGGRSLAPAVVREIGKLGATDAFGEPGQAGEVIPDETASRYLGGFILCDIWGMALFSYCQLLSELDSEQYK